LKEYGPHKKQIQGFNNYSTWKHVKSKLIDACVEIKYSHLGNWYMAMYCHILLWHIMA
jgi:hypothetical protein